MKLTKKYFFLITFLMLLALFVKAQNNTISPYSKLGLGDFQYLGFGQNAAMGGAGIALRSPANINILNPAALSSLDSTIALFEVGFHSDYTHLKTSLHSGAKSNANISYLAIGLGINKNWAMSFGLSPYTNVGYTFETSSPISGGSGNYITKYEGTGGLTKLFLTNAYKLSKNISLGVSVNYLFGPKNDNEYYGLTFNDYYEITQKVSHQYSGAVFEFGYQQTFNLRENDVLTLGLRANAPGKLLSKTTTLVTQRYSESGYEDTLRNEESLRSTVDMPVNFGGGIAYNLNKTLIVTADYGFQSWSDLTVNDDYANLIDNHTLAFGTEFTPKRLSHRTLISYRAGMNYQTGYFDIGGTAINSLTFTTGVAFSLRTMRFNFYGAYSTRGTTANQLIKEDVVRIGVNISFFENWLQRRQYK